MDQAIATHQRSLDKVRFTRAWYTDRRCIDELVNRWQESYVIQELVLGTRNPAWYRRHAGRWRETYSYFGLEHYLCGVYNDYNTTREVLRRGRWGTNIKRIRIDHIDLSRLWDISIISEPFYSHLKILMLQQVLRQSWHKSFRGSERVKEKVSTRLAKRIVTAGAPSLRVVVIANYWYWVARDLEGSKRDGDLWTWADARSDLTQNKLMSSTLDDLDKNFLEPSEVPFWHERDSKEWHRNSSFSQKILMHRA